MTRAHETSLIRIFNPSGAPVGRALSLGDHLGSTSVTTSDTGVKLAEIKYKPWGEVRSETGQTPSDYTFTGQYSHTDDFGLMFFNALWYDPALGRFGQADSIVPNAGDPLAFDRYSYVRNNPARYIDPSGHTAYSSDGFCIGKGCVHDDPVELTEAGQKLKDFSENKHFTPLEVIQMGLVGEVASWYMDDNTTKDYAKTMGIRYQWYVQTFCGGVDSTNCLINFWTIYSQSVNTLVNNYWDESYNHDWIEMYNTPNPIGWVAQDRWDAAGQVLNATLNPLLEWIGLDPDNDPEDRQILFDVGIIKVPRVTDKLKVSGEGLAQGEAYYQFYYFEDVMYENEKALSVIMTYCQWQWWMNDILLCGCY